MKPHEFTERVNRYIKRSLIRSISVLILLFAYLLTFTFLGDYIQRRIEIPRGLSFALAALIFVGGPIALIFWMRWDDKNQIEALGLQCYTCGNLLIDNPGKDATKQTVASTGACAVCETPIIEK